MEDKNKPVIMALILLFLGLTLIYKPFLSPALVYFFFMYCANPFKGTPPVGRLMVAASVLFVLWLWTEIGSIMAPFATALFLAYLLDPVVDKLETWKIKRPFAVAIVLGLIMGVIVTMFILIIPLLIGQVTNLIALIQNNQSAITAFLEKHWATLQASNIIDTATLSQKLQDFSASISGDVLNIFSNVTGVFKYAFQFIIIPVVTFYLLKDYDKIREWIFAQFPQERRTKIESGYNNFNTIFGRYIRGVVLDSSIVGCTTFVLLTILGVPYALFIGIVTMFFNVLPYIGIWISVGFALITVLLSGGSGHTFLMLAIGFGIVQLAEQLVIYPKIMGKMIGFHSVFIMVMLLVLSHFWGLLGLVMGIPLTALAWYYIHNWINKTKIKTEQPA